MEAESLSTKIPEEKTNTCSASKIEDTRCWWQDEGTQRRTGERIMERGKWEGWRESGWERKKSIEGQKSERKR